MKSLCSRQGRSRKMLTDRKKNQGRRRGKAQGQRCQRRKIITKSCLTWLNINSQIRGTSQPPERVCTSQKDELFAPGHIGVCVTETIEQITGVIFQKQAKRQEKRCRGRRHWRGPGGPVSRTRCTWRLSSVAAVRPRCLRPCHHGGDEGRARVLPGRVSGRPPMSSLPHIPLPRRGNPAKGSPSPAPS